MSDTKRELFHHFKNEAIRLQTIMELFLFHENPPMSKQEMLKDGEKTLTKLRSYWEDLKNIS